jgi:PPOX class probable F420-dependent enzyme
MNTENPLAALAEPRVREFLRVARLAHLATADRSGAPHNVPVCFFFDDARFYFVIDEKPKAQRGTALKRMRNIAENPRVAVVVDHYEEDWQQLGYVLVAGTAHIVDDREEYLAALRGLREKYTQYRDMALSRDQNPIVRIEAERAHAWGARFQTAPAG